MYLLDTSILIEHLRYSPSVAELIYLLEGKGELSTSYFCLAELYEGVFREPTQKRRQISEKVILSSLAKLSKIWGMDDDIVKEFGKIRAFLKKRGQVIEDIDIFLAATCVAHDLILVTSNVKHFLRIKGLEIYKK